MRHSRALVCVLVVWSIVMARAGSSTSPRSSSRRSPSTSGDFGFGLLWAGSGIGLVVGGLAAASFIERDVGTAYVRFIALLAVGTGCAAVAPNVWVGAVAMVLGGFGNGGAVVANITLVQRGAPDRVRGRAFTLLMSANYAVLGLSFVVAGPLVNAYGARWAYAGRGGADAGRRGRGGALHAWHRARPRPGGPPQRMTAASPRSSQTASARARRGRSPGRSPSSRTATPRARELVRLLFPHTGRAHVVGITGLAGGRQVDA